MLDGKRTDDGTTCSLVVVRELSGTRALYPHGADQRGVRLPESEAVRMAREILADAE